MKRKQARTFFGGRGGADGWLGVGGDRDRYADRDKDTERDRYKDKVTKTDRKTKTE